MSFFSNYHIMKPQSLASRRSHGLKSLRVSNTFPPIDLCIFKRDRMFSGHDEMNPSCCHIIIVRVSHNVTPLIPQSARTPKRNPCLLHGPWCRPPQSHLTMRISEKWSKIIHFVNIFQLINPESHCFEWPMMFFWKQRGPAGRWVYHFYPFIIYAVSSREYTIHTNMINHWP